MDHPTPEHSAESVVCAAAQFSDEGETEWECRRLDTQRFWVGDDEIHFCPEHARWARLIDGPDVPISDTGTMGP